MKISGTGAMVVGGASGLGAATARALAGAGARVTLLDRDVDRGHAVAAEIGGTFVAVDVRQPDTITTALTTAGPPRIVINCAGIGGGGIRTAGKRGPHPADLFRDLLDVHVTGTFHVCRLAAAAMAILTPLDDGARGIIVNTSSVVAQDGPVGMVAYAAAKGAIEAMTLPMARDLGPAGIRVCTVVPGNFETPMASTLPDELRQGLVAMTPFPKRFGHPAEYAALVCHLIENPMLNGCIIRIDGGIRMSVVG